MNEGTIYATRAEIEAVAEWDNGVYGYIPRSVDPSQSNIGHVRLRVGDHDMDAHYIVSHIDGRDDDWHDHDHILDVNYYEGGVEQSAWVPVTIIDDELTDDIEAELDDAVEALRALGLADATIAAALDHRAEEVDPEEAVPFWKDDTSE